MKQFWLIIVIAFTAIGCSKQLDDIRPRNAILQEELKDADILKLRNGVYALADGILNTANLTRKWQTGFLSSYLFWMVFGLIIFVAYYILKLSVWH